MPEFDQVVWILCCGFATLLIGIIKWGLNRIFSKIDEIAEKFEKISESLSENLHKVYKDIAHADDKIWDRVDFIDRRLIKVESQCALVNCKKDEKNPD